ncbi:GDSL esterase/lipase At5g08460-like isoform X2 [Magnolia sinica]|uniref:GDSL esterase/lipase At5g08460-like isoform X2 n=1 Tax=Magnolia sinica TaxID=86752 RepID=UPI00265AF841|nr:GDSL esterase/lipase At5g08460-like isoform X2 [Magnolia sinica]
MLLYSPSSLLLPILFSVLLLPRALPSPQKPETRSDGFQSDTVSEGERTAVGSSPHLNPLKSPLAPGLFVFGDSTVDCGTNNFLGTLARADLLPYGRDFDTHEPTGRFCNGRIPVDYIALHLGLPFVPAFLGQSGSVKDMSQGVNYASAGAGVLFSSGSDLGQHISLTQQIQQAMDTFQQFVLSMGEEAANDMISKSVFYFSIGSNDYIHYYLPNVSRVQSLFLPWEFNQLLAATIKQELKNLYNANVRRVVVMGMAPLGCTPHYLWKYNSQDGHCVEEINDMVIEFNFAMRYVIDELRWELPDAKVTFCDVFEGSMDILRNYRHYGFETVTDACCGLGRYGDNAWSGLHVDVCYPLNLRDMVP